MDGKTKSADTAYRSDEMDAELAGILTAISIVSRRLARKLMSLSRQDETEEEGGKTDEQNNVNR
jgi:hypothetical protein